MSRRNRLAAAVLALGVPLAAQEASSPLRYSPSEKLFYCDVPPGWQAFEEADAQGTTVHLLGPDGPAGGYRAGIDVRLYEKGQPGYLPVKEAVEEMRRSDKASERKATGLRPLRVSGVLARVFEVTEVRRLPEDRLPFVEEHLHHYVAVVPSCESYFIIRLSSNLEVYLDYRDLFVAFLKSFKGLGPR